MDGTGRAAGAKSPNAITDSPDTAPRVPFSWYAFLASLPADQRHHAQHFARLAVQVAEAIQQDRADQGLPPITEQPSGPRNGAGTGAAILSRDSYAAVETAGSGRSGRAHATGEEVRL